MRKKGKDDGGSASMTEVMSASTRCVGPVRPREAVVVTERPQPLEFWNDVRLSSFPFAFFCHILGGDDESLEKDEPLIKSVNFDAAFC